METRSLHHIPRYERSLYTAQLRRLLTFSKEFVTHDQVLPPGTPEFLQVKTVSKH